MQAEGYLELNLPRIFRRRKPAEPRPCVHTPEPVRAAGAVERAA